MGSSALGHFCFRIRLNKNTVTVTAGCERTIRNEIINYYQQMHYTAIKITQITVFYVIIRAPTCFDPPRSSSGSSEGPY